MSEQFVVGIDLGTTNCAVAYAALNVENAVVGDADIEQVVAHGAVAARSVLPSTFVLTTDGLSVVGMSRARTQSANTRICEATPVARCCQQRAGWPPTPTVARHSPGAPEDIDKISPVVASWRFSNTQQKKSASEGKTRHRRTTVILTVPAFVRRCGAGVTQAAYAAGRATTFQPQAALYRLNATSDGWRK
jgi:molecular chaperone DnaK (HSP70)